MPKEIEIAETVLKNLTEVVIAANLGIEAVIEYRETQKTK